jgi:DDE superfamily endonuclease
MFLDESAANERTLNQKYGWVPIRLLAEVSEMLKHSAKWSILPLYTKDGFIAWDIIHSSYNKELFNELVRNHVIPHTEPFVLNSKNSVLVMDNARIHYNQVISQMRDLTNCKNSRACAKMPMLFSHICHHIIPISTPLNKFLGSSNNG